jgi:hypothetical protein
MGHRSHLNGPTTAVGSRSSPLAGEELDKGRRVAPGHGPRHHHGVAVPFWDEENLSQRDVGMG